jgi:hypothetical protein
VIDVNYLGVLSKFKCFFLQWVSMIGPSLKKLKLWNSPHKEVFIPNTKTKFEYLPNHDLLFCLVEMKHSAWSCKKLINYLEIGLNTQWPNNITKSYKMNCWDWWIWQHTLHNWTLWFDNKINLVWWFGEVDLWHN